MKKDERGKMREKEEKRKKEKKKKNVGEIQKVGNELRPLKEGNL